MVEECIQNDDKALINTQCTTVVLSKGGDNFFIGHIENRERYFGLIDIYNGFIDNIVSKARQVGYRFGTAEQLEQNKDKFRQYLVKNKWNRGDMIFHKLVKNSYNQHLYGKITYDDLRQTKGVKFHPDGDVYICHWNYHGI